MNEIGLGNPDTQDVVTRSVRGGCFRCPQWDKCLFNMPRYGGFKTQGKRYVAYALITDAVENSNGKEDFCTCEAFVETLQDRMLSGRAAADEGRKGAEIVRLLVGRKTVTQGMEMGFNTRGEIIKPQLNLVEDLRRANYKVNLEDASQAARYDIVKFERTIPDYSAPAVTQNTYSEEMRAREAELRRSEIEDEDERWNERNQDRQEAVRKRHKPIGKGRRSAGEVNDEFEELGEETP